MKKSHRSINVNVRYKKSISDVTFIGLFTAIIAISSWVFIPFSIPFTLQTMGVMLCACCLGALKGSIAVIVYIALGAIGIPVFSGFSCGPSHLFGMTGGYILGFVPAVFVTGLIMRGNVANSKIYTFFAAAAGNIICYIFGACYYATVYVNASFWEGVYISLASCVFPYILPDIIKLFLTVSIWNRLRKIIRRG